MESQVLLIILLMIVIGSMFYFQMSSIVFFSHIDHLFIKYCLVVSTSKIYSNLNDAENNLKERPKRNLTTNSSLSVDDDRLEVNLERLIYSSNS